MALLLLVKREQATFEPNAGSKTKLMSDEQANVDLEYGLVRMWAIVVSPGTRAYAVLTRRLREAYACPRGPLA